MQEFDCQLQRALNYEDYSEAQNIRQRRQTIDEALGKLRVSADCSDIHAPMHETDTSSLQTPHTPAAEQEFKGGASGIDPVSDSIDALSSEGVSLRVQLQRAIDEER